jgi:hypothetical protein
VNIIPVDEDGISEVSEDLISDNPLDLVNQRIDFVIEIKRAFDLPIDFCKDVYCEYSFYINDDVKFTTIKIEGKNREPVFEYKKHHTVDICTEPFI